jgi:hypothetical protein
MALAFSSRISFLYIPTPTSMSFPLKVAVDGDRNMLFFTLVGCMRDEDEVVRTSTAPDVFLMEEK